MTDEQVEMLSLVYGLIDRLDVADVSAARIMAERLLMHLAPLGTSVLPTAPADLEGRREQARAGVLRALDGIDPATTRAVLDELAKVPADGELDAYVDAVASVARTVCERQLAMAPAGTRALRREADALAAMNAIASTTRSTIMH